MSTFAQRHTHEKHFPFHLSFVTGEKYLCVWHKFWYITELKRNYHEVECDTIVEYQHILHIIPFSRKTKSWLIFLSTHKKPK